MRAWAELMAQFDFAEVASADRTQIKVLFLNLFYKHQKHFKPLAFSCFYRCSVLDYLSLKPFECFMRTYMKI